MSTIIMYFIISCPQTLEVCHDHRRRIDPYDAFSYEALSDVTKSSDDRERTV